MCALRRFGDPLTHLQRSRLSESDKRELASPTSHLLEDLPFPSKQAGHSHVHYLKVVTKVIKHVEGHSDTIVYKYTVGLEQLLFAAFCTFVHTVLSASRGMRDWIMLEY